MADRDQGGKWTPGISGNPSGRPKACAEVVELARKYTAEAIATLADIMGNGDLRSRVAAAQVLLDRAWGKPSQAVEVTGAEGGAVLVNVILDRSKAPSTSE